MDSEKPEEKIENPEPEPQPEKPKPVTIPPKETPRREPEAKIKIHQLTECPRCKGEIGYDSDKRIYLCIECKRLYQEI